MAPELSEQIDRFEAQYSENPESLVFARLADLYRKDGDPERALEVLQQGLERHPDYLSAHIVRARCLRDLGRSPEAEDAFRHVLDLDSQNLVALSGLASLARERGDEEEAERRYDELLQVDPRNEEAREALEELRGESGDDGPADAGGFEETGAGPAAPDVGEETGRPEPAGEEDAGGPEPGESDDAWAFGLRELPEDSPGEAPDAGAEVEDAAGSTDGDGGERDSAGRPGPEAGSRGDVFRFTGGGAEPDGATEAGPDGEDAGPDPRGGGPGEPDVDEAREDHGPAGIAGPSPGEPAAEDAGQYPAPAPEDATPDGVDREEREPPAGGPGDVLEMGGPGEARAAEDDEDLLTETLASLYETQGFYEEAVEMYRDLLEQRPDDEALRARLERAEEALEESGPREEGPAPGPEVAPGPGPEAEEPPTEETPSAAGPGAGESPAPEPVEPGEAEAGAPEEAPPRRPAGSGKEPTVGEHLRALVRGEAGVDGTPDRDADAW